MDAVRRRNLLFRANRGLVGFCLRRMVKRRWPVLRRLGTAADVQQEAYLLFLRLCERWDRRRGRLSTYAVASIERHLIQKAMREGIIRTPTAPKYIRHEGRRRRCLHARTVESLPANCEDGAVAYDHPFPDLDAREQAARAMRLVSHREGLMIAMLHGLDGFEPRPVKDIADYFGLSKMRVYQIIDKGLWKMKRRLCPQSADRPRLEPAAVRAAQRG